MTPEQFRNWRSLMGWNRAEAAKQLDLGYSTLEGYEKGVRPGAGGVEAPVLIPKIVELACAALALNINLYDGSDKIVFDIKRIKRD